jgi:phosphodiesterase/alkaline phosphatase D-like protein
MMIFFLVIFLLISASLSSQTITHGPVAGGVTDTSARFIMFANSPATLGIQVSANSAFNPVVSQASAMTSASCGNCAIVNVSGLQSNTRYYYRPVINGAYVTGDVRSFKTFPEKSSSGNYVITFGSCMNENRTDDAVFAAMTPHQPDLFLQIGDWGYPDYTDNLPNNPDYFPNDYTRVIESYKNKYNYTHLKELLKNVPVDYVWDDHDYVNNNASRTGSPITDFGIPVTVMEVPIPPQTRRNSIRGYYELFPGYAPVDSSEGIFHKLVYGNVEIYMLDNRAARSPNTEALVNVNGSWTFSPPPGHSIIGNIQREWLLNNLKKSAATWKLIVTGTAFNKTYGNTFSALLSLPNLAGLPLAATLIDCWSGFPMDQDSLINAVNQHQIDGVVILSGDTHTSAMDDGQAGGLPEIMAGCLSQSNSTLYTTVPLLQFGLVWNKGGQGITTNNVNDAFGKISVFGDDSLRMELIDENGVLIARHTIYSCSFQTGLNLSAQVKNVTCHGSADGEIYLTVTGGFPPYFYSIDGEHYQSDSVLRALPPGKYYPVVKDSRGCIRQTKITLNEAPPFNVTEVVSDANCYGSNDGSAFFYVSGGQPPYRYYWSTGATTGGIFNMPAGNYAATVSDAYGCEKLVPIAIHQPDSLQISLNIASAACSYSNDGSVKVLVTGGAPPYNILWSNGSNSFDRNDLTPGNYSFTITDANGCTKSSIATVTGPLPLNVNATIIPDYSGNGEGAIYLTVSGGTPPYTSTWINGFIGDSLINLRAGNYLVQVADANGCRVSRSFAVGAPLYIDDQNQIALHLFPNPAHNTLSVEWSLPVTDNVMLSVYNILGKAFIHEYFQSVKKHHFVLDVSLLPAGSYVLLIEGERFKKFTRFVISR